MQLNVAEGSTARTYTLGVKRNGVLEDDLAFYLVATGGAYKEESPVGPLLSTNWIGYIGVGQKDAGFKRDIAIAFRGTQVLILPAAFLLYSWQDLGLDHGSVLVFAVLLHSHNCSKPSF